MTRDTSVGTARRANGFTKTAPEVKTAVRVLVVTLVGNAAPLGGCERQDAHKRAPAFDCLKDIRQDVVSDEKEVQLYGTMMHYSHNKKCGVVVESVFVTFMNIVAHRNQISPGSAAQQTKLKPS